MAHEAWSGGQLSAEHWLTAYTFFYNHLRGYQALNDVPPAEQLEDRFNSALPNHYDTGDKYRYVQ